MQTTTSTTVKLAPEVKARIEYLADVRKRSAHSLMVEAIERYVTREEQREELRQAGIAAHEHYARTGLHLTNDEVRGWIDQLRQGKNEPMPKCRIE